MRHRKLWFRTLDGTGHGGPTLVRVGRECVWELSRGHCRHALCTAGLRIMSFCATSQ